MSKLLIKEKEVVVPGENLAEGMDYLPGDGCYRDDKHIVASRLGLVRVSGRLIKLIPLSGRYLPKRDDVIIGKVFEITPMGWRIETNSAYSALLNVKDATSEFIARGANLSQIFAIGDYIVTKIYNVSSQMLVDLTTKGPGLHKLNGGRLIEVSPAKVPRIIGKAGSMVSLIKEKTGAKISVGQNGLVWIQAEPKMELITVEDIRLIEKNAHLD